MADLNINVRVPSKVLLWAAAGLLLCAGVIELGSESFTLVTTYPAPSGIYNRMITTGETFLARDGGKVSLGAGRLLQVGTSPSNPQDADEGAIYYNTISHSFLGYQNKRWSSLGGTSAASTIGGGAQMFTVDTVDKNFTVPAEVTKIRVEIYGGGGGGGTRSQYNAGCGACGTTYYAGGGGGGGGVAIKYLTVHAEDRFPVTVGSGGGGNGDGGTSSFGPDLSATGGRAGGATWSGSPGGAGGAGSGGDINLTGGAGDAASGTTGGTGGAAGNGGVGSSNPYGFGGSGGATKVNGGTFGGGGGGATNIGPNQGSGGHGAVFVLW